jgi:NAD(P)H-flavin reductase
MASAKDGTDAISSVLQLYNNPNKFSFQELDYCLKSQVSAVNKLADKIYEVIVRAPLAARNFKPGQFFKLQNFVKNAPINQHGQLLLMEALALTGAETKNDEVSMIILEMGGSSDFCKLLKVGEEVSLMGPTGEATEIVIGQKIILVGGGLGNAVLFSIGKALRANKCEVIYFAGYRNKSSLFKQEEIEAAADQIIWCADDGLIKTNRAIDISFHGNIVNAILEYQNSLIFPLNQASRLITIGSDSMMSAVNKVKHVLKPDVDAIASINSPMQCMMKEICAQCIQEHIDPITGVKSYIYSCYKQDQNMNSVNFEHLKSRLSQQSLLEKISRKIISE